MSPVSNRAQSVFRRLPPAATVDRSDGVESRRFNKRRSNRTERHAVNTILRRVR